MDFTKLKVVTTNGTKRIAPPQFDLATHPLTFLAQAAKSHPEIKGFKLISYDVSNGRYSHTSSEADAEVFVVAAERIVGEGMRIIQESALKGLDVVVSSAVYVNGSLVKHLPLIDLSVPASFSHADIHDKGDFMWAFQKEMGLDFRRFALFCSGRSYHAYSCEGLLTESGWREFMARLLTLPGIPTADSVPDFRWIGHCLLRGFGVLRLSATDIHYLQEPKLVYMLREIPIF